MSWNKNDTQKAGIILASVNLRRNNMTYSYDRDGLSEADCQLADEFETLCTDVQKQINAKMDVARQAIRDAVAISEQHGVPFSGLSFLSNSYVPSSFKDSKFKNLDQEIIGDIAGVYDSYGNGTFEYGGWVHSAVC